MDFKNKVVVVTGASSGMGAAAAVMFSAAGAKIVMVARNQTKLATVAQRCSSPLIVRADLTKEDDSRRVIYETIKKFHQIDILVNCAGIIRDSSDLLANDIMESYDEVMAINLRAIIYLTHLAAPHLIKTKGNIVTISSIVGVLPPLAPGMIAYYVSKAGLNHFIDCAAAELGRHGVRVNAISPGPVKTDLIKNAKSSASWDDLASKTLLGRISEPEEIANLILFFASDKAKSITGSNYVNDNGMSIKL